MSTTRSSNNNSNSNQSNYAAFNAFPSYPASLSASRPSPHTLIAPRTASVQHRPLVGIPQSNTRSSSSSSFNNNTNNTKSQPPAADSASSGSGTRRGDGEETPPSSPGSTGEWVKLKQEEEEEEEDEIGPMASTSTSTSTGAVAAGTTRKGRPAGGAAKVPAKRGRKKKPTPDELDEMEDLAAGGDGSKRSRRDNLSAPEKRKVQNRVAQRAFRERKEKHVKDMEERVVDQEAQILVFRDIVDRLIAENQALRRGEAVPVTNFVLPPHLPSLVSPTAGDVLPPINLSPPVPAPSESSPNTSTPNTASNQQSPDLSLTMQNVDMELYSDATKSAFARSAGQNQNPTPPATSATAVPADIQHVADPSASTEFNFSPTAAYDFDAPFDFSAAIPLPPLFQDLFSQSFAATPEQGINSGGSPATFSRDEEVDPTDEDMCPIGEEDDGELTLPNGRLPCDKPQCDFSLISCALPIPWRPPAIGKDVPAKDVWTCTQAWAKLCSHPLFGDCDVDELCHELRDKTLCSDDGRVVIAKADVCDVFRSIPARAKARREQMDLLP